MVRWFVLHSRESLRVVLLFDDARDVNERNEQQRKSHRGCAGEIPQIIPTPAA
jgi:hypothetical protein